MPVTIDPFAFDPTGPFQPLVNYWHCTMQRLIYYDRDDLLVSALAIAGAGAGDWERFEQTAGPLGTVIPRTDVYHLPAGDMVSVRGTVDNFELIAEVAASGLVSLAPWPGRVSLYFGPLTTIVWGRIAASVSVPWIAAGHSLGGAVAGMLYGFGAQKIWTIGQPREGNVEYAEARDNAKKLRLFNAEDLVPKVPLAVGSFARGWLTFWVPFPAPNLLADYWHWGIGRIGYPDGFVEYYGAQDRGNLNDARSFITELFERDGGVWAHAPELYAYRVRVMIPYVFPVDPKSPTLPGLAKLDQINQELNLGPLAELRGSAVNWFIKPGSTSREGGGMPADGADVIQDWEEYRDEDETAVSPFRCPDEV